MTFPATGLAAPFTPDTGFLDIIAPADPAAGANLTITLGPGRFVVINAVTFTLTTDSNAANRFVAVEYLGRGGLATVRNAATTVITASTTNQVFQFDNQHTVSEWNTNTPIYAPLLPVPLSAGWGLRVTIDSIQAGDAITSCKVLCTRYFAASTFHDDDDG